MLTFFHIIAQIYYAHYWPFHNSFSVFFTQSVRQFIFMQLKVTKNQETEITLNFIVCIVAGAQGEKEKESLEQWTFLKNKRKKFLFYFLLAKKREMEKEKGIVIKFYNVYFHSICWYIWRWKKSFLLCLFHCYPFALKKDIPELNTKL